MRFFSATDVHLVAIHISMLQSWHRLCQLASTSSMLTELSMLISMEHVTLTHECRRLTGWILELCLDYLPIHKIHCALPFARRTFVLKLLMPVIIGLPSWCFSSKMGRTSYIYFTVYSHKTAEVGCFLTVYCAMYIWLNICYMVAAELVFAECKVQNVFCCVSPFFHQSFWMAKVWNIKNKL
jgi:hypothetical protein